MKIEKYLRQSPMFALNAAYESVIPELNSQLRRQHVNLLQGLVLTALFFEDRNDVRPSELAALLHTSRGNMSHILSELESQALIKRVVSRKDARYFEIELKSTGRKRAIELIKFFDSLQDRFEKQLGLSACQKTVDGLLALANTFRNHPPVGNK